LKRDTDLVEDLRDFIGVNCGDPVEIIWSMARSGLGEIALGSPVEVVEGLRSELGDVALDLLTFGCDKDCGEALFCSNIPIRDAVGGIDVVSRA